MATLEKIRNKSALLFTIIIVALLAFILGDFFNSSRSLFGPGTAAAKVAGEQIDIQEFNRRVEERHQAMQQQGYTNVDNTRLQEQILNEMINEALMNKELNALGITVTDKELSAAMIGDNALRDVAQVALQYGFESTEQFYDFAFEPAKYNIPQEQSAQLQQAWIELEGQVEEYIRGQVFYALVSGAITANKLDAKAQYEENVTSAMVEYARVDLATLNGDEYTPTDAEIKAKYDDLKNKYKLDQPVRKVNYIVVDIVPSQEDLLAAQQNVEEALSILNSQPGCDGLSGKFVSSIATGTKNSMRSESLKNLVSELPVDSAKLLSFNNYTYTLVKLLSKEENVADSVKFDAAMITVRDAAQRDSILNALNAGAKLADFVAAPENLQEEQSLPLLDPNYAQAKDLFADATPGKYFTPDTAAGAESVRIFKVVGYSKPVTAYNYAEITYTVDPSSTTINNLNANLRDFLATNNTAEKFAEEAPKEGFHIFPAEVTLASLSIANIEGTRGAVKWALNAKVGEVSQIYSDDQSAKLVAVALKAAYEDFTPVSDETIKMYITSLATNDKKAAKLIEDFKGKGTTLAEYASAMNASIDTTEVAFGKRAISGFGMNESEFAAAVATADVDQVVGPIQTNNSVVVFKVDVVNKEGREFNFENDAANFNRQYSSAIVRNLNKLLLGNEKVTYNLLNFYQD